VGRDYPMGTALHMGSGYFPFVLGVLLLMLGAVICIKSLVIAGEAIESIGLRPLLLVLMAIGAFAMSDTLGLVAATILMTVIGAAASPESRWREVVVLTIVLLGLSVGVFAYGLGLPFTLFPF